MANRRYNKVERWGGRTLARIWQARLVLFLAVPYLALAAWLFAGKGRVDARPAQVYSISEVPEWRKPDVEHWFGATGSGIDLFQLSRVGMATSLAVGVVASALGIGLAHLLVMMFAFDAGEKRFRWLHVISRTWNVVPATVLLVILAGGGGGSQVVAIAALAVLIGLCLAPTVASWFREGEESFDALSAYALGLSRVEIVTGRVLPKVLRRHVGLFAALVPVVMLVEMSLSYLGFTGDRITCGSLIAHGQELIIEAPWMAICPGIMATAVILALTFLGWCVSTAMRTGPVLRFF